MVKFKFGDKVVVDSLRFKNQNGYVGTVWNAPSHYSEFDPYEMMYRVKFRREDNVGRSMREHMPQPDGSFSNSYGIADLKPYGGPW